jgi:hypothetical protein
MWSEDKVGVSDMQVRPRTVIFRLQLLMNQQNPACEV